MPTHRAIASFRRVPPIAAAVAIAFGVLVLAGWTADSPLLKSVLPGRVAMNPATAVCFVLAGLSILILYTDGRGPRARLAGTGCASIVALTGALKLVGLATGWDVGIDRLLFTAKLDTMGGPVPNSMAPNTALNFLFVGLALVAMRLGDRPGRSFFKQLALPPLVLSLLALTGYAYGMRAFYGVTSYIPMALNTSVCFLAVSVGILLAHPERGLTRVFTADDLGGAMARRLFPLTVGALLALGWIRFHGERMGLYGAELGIQLSVFVSSLLMGVVIWISARSLSLADSERRAAMEQVRSAHEGLERRVQERTAELTEMNRELEREVRERREAQEALKKSEEQLRQSQKMEAIGRLAGGVAHDFNNMLTAIMGYSQLLRLRFPPEDPCSRDLMEIEKAGERAASLTSQLLAFSRRQVLQPQILDLNALVADMDKMLRRLIGADIDLLTSPGSTGFVRADPGQIELVLLNLVVNARDAMPRGGKITIETADVHLDATYVRDRAGLVSGPYVMMSVSDTGAGIDPEAKPHIFEPFFTTKEVGKGTGLGLSTVYGIVKQSDGHIEVYSERDRGATFKIYLPRSTAAAGAAGAAPPVARPPGGTESILLVEDEDLVRAVIRKALEMHGYRVLEARDGVEALRMLEDTSPDVDLIVTDVMMPQITGPELARRAARRFRGLKVLFVSGYTDKAVIHHGLLGPGTAFMQKPFAPDALARKVREVLDGDPAQAA